MMDEKNVLIAFVGQECPTRKFSDWVRLATSISCCSIAIWYLSYPSHLVTSTGDQAPDMAGCLHAKRWGLGGKYMLLALPLLVIIRTTGEQRNLS